MAINFPSINPVAVTILGFPIYWYGVSYFIGALLIFYMTNSVNKNLKLVNLKKSEFEALASYIILGIIIGGRLGYIFFYEGLDYKFFDIINIRKGGMSFHGALIGSGITTILFAKHNKKNFLSISDLMLSFVPLGLLLGRIANFINAELYGRKTSIKWGVIFPSTDLTPRHPSQLYEAFGEGLILFAIMMFFLYKTKFRKSSGMLTGIFLISYSLIRFFIEFFREPDEQIGFIFKVFTMGQLLCIPFALLGGYLVINRKLHHRLR